MEPVRQETWIKDFSNVFISRLKRLFSALKMGGGALEVFVLISRFSRRRTVDVVEVESLCIRKSERQYRRKARKRERQWNERRKVAAKEVGG